MLFRSYEASEALRLARLPKYDYGLNNLYDYMQVSETVNVPELAPEFEIKLECFYEDYAEVPWEFGESNGVVEHSGRYGNLGNGNVELWCGHNQYHYLMPCWWRPTPRSNPRATRPRCVMSCSPPPTPRGCSTPCDGCFACIEKKPSAPPGA